MNKKTILILILSFMLLTSIMPISYSNNTNYLVPDLVYSPTSYDLGYVEEGKIYEITFEIWNGGTDTLTWNLGIVDTWISPNPTSGSSTGEHDIVSIKINTTDLTSGSHSGFVSISANDGGGVRYFNIDLFINNPPNTPVKPSGPTSVEEGRSYQYSTRTTDPDGDNIRYGFDFNNDDVIEPQHWTTFIPSGNTMYVLLTFYGIGTRNIRAKAEDIYGAQSDFSSALTVQVYGANNPPNTPNTPIGPSTGKIGISYTFSTGSNDPDNDDIKYGWDWDGDNTIDEWTSLYPSGTTISKSHIWTSEGTYNIKVKAEDSKGAQSAFSLIKTIIITSANNPPNKPTIMGPSSGKTGDSHTYIVSTEDPDNDEVYYLIDWDDTTNSGWIGPYYSGLTATSSHIWSANGTYSIKVKSKDIYGEESPWSDPLEVTMPKIKIINQIPKIIYRYLKSIFLNKFLIQIKI